MSKMLSFYAEMITMCSFIDPITNFQPQDPYMAQVQPILYIVNPFEILVWWRFPTIKRKQIV